MSEVYQRESVAIPHDEVEVPVSHRRPRRRSAGGGAAARGGGTASPSSR